MEHLGWEANTDLNYTEIKGIIKERIFVNEETDPPILENDHIRSCKLKSQ